MDSSEQLIQAIAWRQWKVVAYTGKRRDVVLGESFVLADTEEKAMELGKTALRLIGIRGQFRVQALRYFPWRDWRFAGFIQRTEVASIEA